ncbi:hypothetical protein LIER_21533 [Lithospermum erythrorhizon]|uniref:CCHC-type domain-containing protein n=1 Tax=Lithospermum erythrorhizon TaxID=34254 RepID=A0AAV3QT18_LITER
MDLDLALRVDRPTPLTAERFLDDKREFEKWERSNLMSLMIIKCSILNSFRGAVSNEITDVKNFLAEVENVKNDKNETSTLLQRFLSMKFKVSKGNIREYIMEMSHIASKVKALKLDLSDDLLVHLVLLSLPPQFGQFKVSYNCQKEKWTLNELISHGSEEEERLKQEKVDVALFTSKSKDSGKKRKFENKAANQGSVQRKQNNDRKVCFFCGKSGHLKKNCIKYQAWLDKRGKTGPFLNLVCYEVNLASVPRDTWWVDSGAATHISVSMQDCLSHQKSIDVERYIYVGDGNSIEVDAIGTFRLLLGTGFYLDLKDTFIVLSFRWNLISVSLLDKSGYCCSFENRKFSLSLNSSIVGTGSLCGLDNLYFLDNVETRGTKRKLNKENMASLWHERLGHVSKERIQRLLSDGILDSLDFTNFDICVSCIKGKYPNKRGHYSRYGYLYLIHEKSESLDVFKAFKAKVELQLNKRIKAVRFDRGGENYGRYDGSGEQRPGPKLIS